MQSRLGDKMWRTDSQLPGAHLAAIKASLLNCVALYGAFYAAFSESLAMRVRGRGFAALNGARTRCSVARPS
jgi:hypothetical protein